MVDDDNNNNGLVVNSDKVLYSLVGFVRAVTNHAEKIDFSIEQ